MCRRCDDQDNEDYGARGIRVDPRWYNDFAAFVDDMGPRPPGHTLDRVDTNAGYSKENCRWATPTEQANNRRSSHHLTFRGETLTVTQWARRVGLKHQTIFYRLYAGWPVEQALTTPSRKNGVR
jgi:hypothetical protein